MGALVMNPSQQARELIDAPPAPWTFADWSDAAVAVGVVAVLIFFGGWWARGLSDESERERIAALPKPVVERPNPLLQWQCTKQEFAEYRGACYLRAKSTLLKPQ